MRTLFAVSLLFAGLFIFSACGAEERPASSAGKQLFVSSCGSCHTLSDAGTQGVAGPNLDNLSLSEQQVAAQVTNGGGGMPAFAGTLSEAQINELAAYVSSVSGR